MAQQEHRNALKSGHELHWYRIEGVLGQGGFGITYRASDPNLAQSVAIKEYLPMDLAVRDGDNSVYPASASNGERYRWGLDRFIAEARTLAKFKHPAVVRVLSVFEENNTAYMVMEFEEGESLQQVLERRKTLDEPELVPILAPLLDGLELVHASGFIHRDIKPANIYIRGDQSPVLLDFGSARQALGEQTKSLTSIVSPGYAPFEQYYSKSDRQGPWTDIYSLAATMYRAISGVLPMNAIDRSEAILKAERDVFVTAYEIGEGRYSEKFVRALDHALNFSEKKRPQTISEWRTELGFESRNSAAAISHAISAPSVSELSPMSGLVPADEAVTVLAEPFMPSVLNEDAVPIGAPDLDPGEPSERSAGSLARRRTLWGTLLAAIVLFVAFALMRGPETFIATFEGSLAHLGLAHDQSELESLLAEGESALAAGQVFDPIQGSALDFFQRALALAPSHDRAKEGMSSVLSRMRLAVEEAIADDELSRANDLLASLHKLTESDAVLQGLDDRLAEENATSERNTGQETRITTILDEAAIDLKAGRLIAPAGNNALVRYQAILLLEPENGEARRGISTIAAELEEQFTLAMADEDIVGAEFILAQLEPLVSDAARINPLRETLASAREKNSRARAREVQLANLLALAAIDLQENRLATPESGNALDRYKQVLALDPGNQQARDGLRSVAGRYVALARGAVRDRQFDNARRYIAHAETLGVTSETVAQLSAELRRVENDVQQNRNATHTLEQEKQRLAEEARLRMEQERTQLQIEATTAERRRLGELEATRRLEMARPKPSVVLPDQDAQQETLARSRLVVAFDGFDEQLETYGLKRQEVHADIESRLRELGYKVVLGDGADHSNQARRFVVKFRANLNAASGVFSYATALLLYDLPAAAINSASESSQQPIWDRGTTGVAVQAELRRVREEYVRSMQQFATEVGPAPGRL